ncbi:hypothetical protein Tco_0606747 [Tanacetum coccineum]
MKKSLNNGVHREWFFSIVLMLDWKKNNEVDEEALVDGASRAIDLATASYAHRNRELFGGISSMIRAASTIYGLRLQQRRSVA